MSAAKTTTTTTSGGASTADAGKPNASKPTTTTTSAAGGDASSQTSSSSDAPTIRYTRDELTAVRDAESFNAEIPVELATSTLEIVKNEINADIEKKEGVGLGTTRQGGI
jgi:hypothetical protein